MNNPKQWGRVMAVSLVVWWFGLWMTDAPAASVTNIYNGSVVTTNVYTVSPVGGDEVVDIWTNGAQLTVITNLAMGPSGAGSRGVILFDGSTNTLQGGTAVIALQTYAAAGATSIICLVNKSLWNLTGDTIGFGQHVGDGAGYNALLLTNSTVKLIGSLNSLSIGYSVNQRGFLGMWDGSVIDMTNAGIYFGANPGAYGEGMIVNSTITNLGGWYVGNSQGNANVTLSNSAVYFNSLAGAGYFNVGGTTSAVLTLNNSTMSVKFATGPFFDIASVANRTGTVNVVNGSLLTIFTLFRPIQVGSGGYGVLNVSNATMTLAFGGSDIDLGIGTVTNANGYVNLYDATNLVERSIIVGRNGGTGYYTADGGSYVQVNYTNRNGGSIVIGQDAGSTGTFTVAGTSRVIATNATSTNIVGQSGQGSLIVSNSGMVIATKTIVGVNATSTNNTVEVVGVGSVFTNSGAFDVTRGTLRFTADAAGFGQILIGGAMSNSATARLEVDVGSYQFRNGRDFVLVDYGTLTNGFATNNVAITGGYGGRVDQLTGGYISVHLYGPPGTIFMGR